MAPFGRIRLKAFIELLGVPRETYRSMLAQRRVPFRTDAGTEGQMTYGGAEVLAMEIFYILTRDGSRQDYAAHDIIASGVVATALEAMEAERDLNELCFVVPTSIFSEEPRPILWPFAIRASDLGNFAAYQLGSADAPAPNTFEGREIPRLGFRSLRIVPLGVAYREAQERASAGGYTLDGISLIRKSDVASE